MSYFRYCSIPPEKCWSKYTKLFYIRYILHHPSHYPTLLDVVQYLSEKCWSKYTNYFIRYYKKYYITSPIFIALISSFRYCSISPSEKCRSKYTKQSWLYTSAQGGCGQIWAAPNSFLYLILYDFVYLWGWVYYHFLFSTLISYII